MSLRLYPPGNSGSREGTALAPTPTRWRTKKMLSKGLRSHSGWRGFATPAHTARNTDSAKRAIEPEQGNTLGHHPTV